MKIQLSVILMGLAFLAFISCKPTQTFHKMFTYGTDDNLIEVNPGDSFELTFVTNASTGYCWILKNKEEIRLVDSVSNRYEQIAPQGMIGAPVHRLWGFRAKKTGTDTLKFAYIRPWEPDNAAKERTVVVRVNK